MNQLLSTLPKGVVATLALVVGFIFLILNDPPRTICDTQLEIFEKTQQGFLFPQKRDKRKVPGNVPELIKQCRLANDPGGCFSLFVKLKQMTIDLDQIPGQCGETAGKKKEIQFALLEGAKLLVQLAWGGEEPTTYSQRNGWLDASDVALFCDLQRISKEYYGDSRWQMYREGVMKALPQKNPLSREQIWQRSLFSLRCENFR